ncbi:class I SAM-dependent methyltransferase [Caldisericum exile]|uniref:class I SAM-dependent methyltransferase n=1 Tax=Caldisericum exile TaxID=693075 RepID=UPI003C714DCD
MKRDKILEDLVTLTQSIEGWLSPTEGILLFNLAKSCEGKGYIVEIGSWKGRSTVWLGWGSKFGKNLKVFAIDPHIGSSEHIQRFGKIDTFNEFLQNIKAQKLDDIVVPLRCTSYEASTILKEPVELIFIDGAHEYDMVKQDFELWFPKLVEGGIMAFHDTDSYKRDGPRRVVEEFLYKSQFFKDVRFVDSITYGKKVVRNSRLDRIKNHYSLLLLRFRIVIAAKIHLPKTLRKIGKKLINFLQL